MPPLPFPIAVKKGASLTEGQNEERRRRGEECEKKGGRGKSYWGIESVCMYVYKKNGLQNSVFFKSLLLNVKRARFLNQENRYEAAKVV